ncbi:alpha/beta fold hydrolase [uncultured Croceitalea sp.]|uniref:alpha/beta hydrolase family protein n=1 Tax=uncultured Croceitalea sp. TaxID=1798908 RepID=UPI0033065B8F
MNSMVKAIDIQCEDGIVIKGEIFSPAISGRKKKTVIINSATGVSRSLYKNYAVYLAENGFDVMTYDYRGIAASRPKKMRGFEASFTIWGQRDFTAVLAYVKKHFPDNKVLIMGHSIGGTLVGMSKDSSVINGILNIGAQTAFYKDWRKGKYKLYFLWHLVFPLVTSIVGYFPGKRLGLLEDIPRGVIAQWNARRKSADMVGQLEKNGNRLFYHHFKGRLLTLGIEDDAIGTEPAIRRIHDLFTSAKREIELVKPKELGVDSIGHFGFFSRKFTHTLWKRTMDWYTDV